MDRMIDKYQTPLRNYSIEVLFSLRYEGRFKSNFFLL